MKMKHLLKTVAIGVYASIITPVLAQVPTNGVLAWYPMDGNAIDASGNNNNGSINGPTSTTDRFNRPDHALLFSGNGQYISVSNNVFSDTLTLSAWVYINSFGSTNPLTSGKLIFFKAPNTGYNQDYVLGIGYLNNQPIAQFIFGQGSSEYVNLVSKSVLTTNQWYLITATRENGVAKLYINSNLDNSVNYSFTPVNQNFNLNLGMSVTNSQSFDGKLDELLIYNRALNDSEISNMYNEQPPYTNSIVLQPGAADGKDATINNHPINANLNIGADPSIASVAWTQSGTAYIQRGLFDFDLSIIPANAIITSAKLSLYNDPTGTQNGGKHSSLSGSNACYLQRITSAWDENTVTWNTKPSTTTQNQVTLSQSTSSNQNYLDIDVATLVQDMKNNPSSSFGFMLSLQTEQYYRAMVCASSDHIDSTLHPKLVLNYIDCDLSSKPFITANGTTTFCQGDSVALTVSSGSNYLWSNGATTQSINELSTGNYSVQVSDSSGCKNTSSLMSVLVNVPSTYTWTRKADFGGTKRFASVGFSVATKGYIGLGSDASGYQQDLWEYDPLTDSWTQKANYPGGKRYAPSAFSIGDKAYIGLGTDGVSAKKDFWEYTPSTNTWLQKAIFPGTARYSAEGFSIGAKGYIAAGSSGGPPFLSDFWEYDQATDTWVKKANIGGGSGRHKPGAFVIGDRGYICGGSTNNYVYANDLWEYNTAANTWTQKASFGGSPRNAPTGFAIGNKGYIGLGQDSGGVRFHKDFWQYDPLINTWNQVTDFGGTERCAGVGFVIGNKGYVGTGFIGTSTFFSDFWEFSPVNAGFASLASACVNQSLAFKNSGSTGICTTHYWDFGTGATPATSSLENPTGINYSTSGIKQIMHIVSAGGIADTVIKTISIDTLPAAEITASGATTFCQGDSVVLTASEGGTRYLWSNGATTQGITVIASETDSVTVTNVNGCSSISASLNIKVNSLPAAAITASGALTFCDGDSVLLTASPADSYLWSNGSTTQSITVKTTETDSVQVTDANACSAVSSATKVIVRQPTRGTDVQTACNSYTWIDGNTYTSSNNTATYTLTNAAGCDSVVTLNLTINNSNTGTDTQAACNSYIWIDGKTYTSSNNIATYTLKNVAGCDSVVTLNLTINNSNTGIDVQTACNSYTWIDGKTYTSSNNTATYTLKNVAGCDSVVTLNLTINKSNTGTDTQTACNSYKWIDGKTYTSSNNTATYTLKNVAGCDSVVTLNLTINNSNTGTDVRTACNSYKWIDGNTYTSSNNTATYTLKNVTGCDSVVTLNLTINNSNTGTDVQTACDSYTWMDGNTYTSSNNTATYTLTNAAGCDSLITLDLTVIQPILTAQTLHRCAGDVIVVGSHTYNATGTYTDVLMASNGCDSIITTKLTISPAITISTNTTSASCGNTNGSATAVASGGTGTYTYLWSNGNTGMLAPNLGYGTYTVTATDAGACSQSAEVTITETAGFTINVDNVKNVTCNDSAEGAINITIKGGSGPFSYSWSNGSITEDIANLKAGVYNVIVQDAKNICRAVKSITISEPSAITINTSATKAKCGGADGSATVSVEGGTSPYTYSWNDSLVQTTKTAIGLKAKTYEVQVTDASGCIAKKIVPVSSTNAPVVSVSSKNISCKGGLDGAINVTVTGGSAPYQQLWSGPGLISSISGASKSYPGLRSGLYSYQVTDKTGCSSSGNVTLTQPEALSLTVTASDVNCDLSNGRASVTVNGGVMPYNYLWSNNKTSADISSLSSGSYSVVVKDSNGCVAKENVNIGARAASQSFCLITVDAASGKNVLVWEKTQGLKTQIYNIYRETSSAGVYEKIGTVPYDSLSVFIDESSNPEERTYRYKISTVDSCTEESAIITSAHSKTLHLAANYGLPKPAINLAWENYEGFPFGTYRIWRGTNARDMSLLDSVPSNIYTYTDDKPPLDSDSLYYSLEVVHLTTCTANYKTGNSYNSAKSNTASISRPDTTTSIVDRGVDNSTLAVYPNPNQGVFTLSLPLKEKQDVRIRVFNMQGQLIHAQYVSGFAGGTLVKELDLSNYSKGIYHIQVMTDKGIYNQKVGIE